MPELPEVETIMRSLAPNLVEKIIEKVIIRETRLRWPVDLNLPSYLEGQTVQQISRRSKYLLVSTLNGHLLIHLGMSGNLRILPQNTPVKKHDHVDIHLSSQQILRYHDTRRFGCILWTTQAPDQHVLLRELGQEPLTPELTGDYWYQRARSRKLAVKNYIMDNHIVVGIGNIYANEALFLAGIHPNRAAQQLTLADYQRLLICVRRVLNTAIAMGGTTLRDFTDGTGKEGYFKNELQIYGREGEKCTQCGKIIKHMQIGQRSSYYCPHCQAE